MLAKPISLKKEEHLEPGIAYNNGAAKTIELKGKMTDPMTGLVTDVRQTMKMVDDNTRIMEQYGMKDGKEYKSMEIKFTRKN